MYNIERLQRFIERTPEGAHFVLLSEPDVKRANYQWRDTKPTKREAIDHIKAMSTNRVGLIVSSLGWGVVDYDGTSESELSETVKKVAPVACLPTPGGVWHRHLVLHLSSEELHRHHKSRKLSIGDWRCGNGYVVLHPGCETDIIKALDTTKGVPRVGGYKHQFEALFPKQLKKEQKKQQRQQKQDDSAPQKRMCIPKILDLDEAGEVQWMLRQLGYECQFIHLKNKFLLNDQNAEGILTSHLRSVCNHRFSREVTVKGGGTEAHPVNFSAARWEESLKAVMFRTKCDPLADWLRAQSHPDIQSLADAEAYATSWFHEIFEVKGGRTEFSEYLSMLIIVGVVARRRHPGIIIKHYPVVAGPSNTGKTALVESLLPDAFKDYAQPRLNLKKPADDLVYDVAGMSVVELNEMGSTRKADSAHIKGWLSEGHFKGRLRYARSATSIPFTHFIIGTANLDDAPLPSDPVAAQRFFIQEIVERPQDPANRVEDYLERNRVKMFAAANMIVNSWEVGSTPKANRIQVEKRIRTIPPHLRVGHEKRTQEYSFDPHVEAEMKVWEWITGETPTSYGTYNDMPRGSKMTPDGQPCWGLGDISDAVPEFGKIRSSGDKSKVLQKVGFERVRITSGRWRNFNIYVIPDEMMSRIREARREGVTSHVRTRNEHGYTDRGGSSLFG